MRDNQSLDELLHQLEAGKAEKVKLAITDIDGILRGKVMVENGQYFGSPRDGRYLKRKIPQKIRDGAAL